MTRLINDVRFTAVTAEDFTVDYDLYMEEVINAMGLLECIMVKGDIIHTLEIATDTPRLLAGIIKIENVRWSRTLASTTERAILRCTEDSHRIQLFEMLLTGLNVFFETRNAIIQDFPNVVATGVTGVLTKRELPDLRGSKNYGQWDTALRVLAGYNPDILIKELDWHLRDLLLAYEHYIKRETLTEYRHQTAVYATVAPYAKKGTLKPPKIPRVLKGHRSNG